MEEPSRKQNERLGNLLGTCIVFVMSWIFVIKLIAGAFPPALKAPVDWYGVPALFIAFGLIAARVTGVLPEIRLFGAGLTWRKALLFAAIVTVVAGPVNFGVVWITVQKYPELVRQAAAQPILFGSLFRSLVGSPLGEEVLFRGFLLSWLASRNSQEYRIAGCTLTTANILTSLAFMGVHLLNGWSWYTPISLIGIFGVALVVGRAKERTGGLLVPMVCHSLVNLTAFLANVIILG